MDITKAYVGNSMYKSGKKRISDTFGGEKFQNIKEKMLDAGEEGFIKAYNLGQKVREKVFGVGKDEEEEGNINSASGGPEMASASASAVPPITEEEKVKINQFKTNLDKINEMQKRKNSDETGKVYGNPSYRKPGSNWLEKYTDDKGRTRALSRKKFFDKQRGVMLKGDNIRTRALRDLRNRLGLRRRRIY